MATRKNPFCGTVGKMVLTKPKKKRKKTTKAKGK